MEWGKRMLCVVMGHRWEKAGEGHYLTVREDGKVVTEKWVGYVCRVCGKRTMVQAGVVDVGADMEDWEVVDVAMTFPNPHTPPSGDATVLHNKRTGHEVVYR